MKPSLAWFPVLLFACIPICEAQSKYTFHTVGFESRAIDLADDGTLLFSSPHRNSSHKYYVRKPNGKILELELPDETYAPTGINSHGTIVGNRFAVGTVFASDVVHFPVEAFHRSPGGEITEFRLPDAARTLAYDINDRGDIVGGYRITPLEAEWPYGFMNVNLGFVHNEFTAKTQTFADAEGALLITSTTELGRMIGSFEEDIKLTGAYTLPGEFILEHDQRKPSPDCERGRLLWFDLNDFDQSILSCSLSTGLGSTDFNFPLRTSYVFDGETHNVIEYPGSSGTRLTSINNAGTLAGTAFFGDGSGHAFVSTVPEPTFRIVWCSIVLLFVCIRSRRR